MGVKSTVELSRREAIERLVVIAQRRERRRIEAGYTALTNKELENVLEAMNDEENGGEGFENYSIVEQPH